MRYFELQEFTFQNYDRWQYDRMRQNLANEHEIIYTCITTRTVLVRKQIAGPVQPCTEEWRICPHSGGEENFWVFSSLADAISAWNRRNLSGSQFGIYRYTVSKEKYEHIRGVHEN